VKEWGPFVYGYSVTIGTDGKPHVQEFGNVKPGTRMGRPSLSVREQREPLVDIVETNDDVRVIAELPGVEKEDITLHGTAKILSIAVDTKQHKFYKDVELPAVVDPKHATSSYKNGVLEVVLKKWQEEKPKGERINIE
jgi:HSP20 family protein